MLKIFYGIYGNRIDVTDVCLEKLTTDDVIAIPHDDHKRARVFGDPVAGTEKNIFVVINNVEYDYDPTFTIKIKLSDLSISHHKNIYTAVMIEFRQHKALKFVLTNFLENLPDEWNFAIFHGNLNAEYVNNIVNELKGHSHRIILHHLYFDNFTVDQYSGLLINKDIYNNIPTETFLIFQTDSIILKKNRHKIYNFLEYDYVGAPWTEIHSFDVGNGGLSLRKKSKMLEIIDKEDHSRRDCPEDFFFARPQRVSIYKPNASHALSFSIEYWHGNNNPFGCHKPWGLSGINSEFCQMHPEIIELYELNQ